MVTTKLKASDRQTLLRKIVAILKKKYGGSVPTEERSVLETMLFACCLEDTAYDKAEAAYQNLLATFFDLNEIRVSSISEVERALQSLDDPAWRAFRVHDILQHVFEEYYVFDFEPLRRKTMDAAIKHLTKIKGLSPFIQLYTLQQSLGAHVIPLDATMCRVVAWLGLVAPEASAEQAAEELKSSIRKADVPLLCHLLRQLGADPDFRSSFRITKSMLADGAVDPTDAPERLQQLLETPRQRSKKVSRRKGTPDALRKAARANRSAAGKKSVIKKVSRPKRTPKKKTSPRGMRKK
jgi:endonuclease-3